MTPGQVKICVAEFVAALITIETFADECAGKLTYLELDNTVAHAWFEAARCPEFPFDRCAQGTHLYMLGRNMKVKTRWITSEQNVLADKCSRMDFDKKAPGHKIGGRRLLQVRPRWMSMLKYVR